MGFFSWKCAESGRSVANRYSGQPKEQTQCYLVTPEKTYYEDSYEGYGEFGGVDVYALLGGGDRDKGIDVCYDDTKEPPFDIKVVLKRYYRYQKYEDLPKSEECENQGYFY